MNAPIYITCRCYKALDVPQDGTTPEDVLQAGSDRAFSQAHLGCSQTTDLHQPAENPLHLPCV